MSRGALPRRRSMTDAFSMLRDPEAASTARGDLMNMLERARQREARLDEFAASLPKLTENDLVALGQADSTCPICLTSLLALLAEEEMALAMDTPAHPVEEHGVTRLAQTCGHIFCRKDIRGWLYQGNRTCPTCRRPFITPDPADADSRGNPTTAPEAALLDELLDGALAARMRLEDLIALGSPLDWIARDVDVSQRPRSGGERRTEAGRDRARGNSDEDHQETGFDYDDDRGTFSGMYS
ncbi:hypothetical protein C8Q78DRAFT_974662 [Trametes maxima]|nr:hypothetical protein C8Q78DRAFT_974662 [Trametes maxima]